MHVIVDGVIYARQRYGGINTYFNEVLPRIAQKAHTSVDVLLPRDPQGRPPGPPVRLLSRDFILPRTGLSWRLDQKLEPVIESLKLTSFGLWAKTWAQAVFQSTYFTSLPGSVPQIAMALDMNHELFPEFYGDLSGLWLRRRYPEYLRTATRIIAISKTTKKHVEQYYSIAPELIDVVYPAINPATFHVDRQHLRILTDARDIHLPYILYVGGRWHYKNFTTLLEAVARFYRRSGLTLVVAGPPWDEKESLEIPAHGAAPALQLVPDPDDDLLRLLYNFATAFVFPSFHEGFGIPLLEAMACGTPVVASDTPIFREVAGNAAVYFNPHSPDDLARAIEQCLDERTARKYRDRGLLRVAQYSWDTTAAQTWASYQRALG